MNAETEDHVVEVEGTGEHAPRIPADKYQILFELGRGGMGSVFLAIQSGPGGFNKLHVLKQLRPELASDPDFLTMFLEEARLSARINHPNVVQTYEVGFDGQQYVIAMEYMNGESLHAIVRRSLKDPKFTLPMHVKVLAEMLNGLHYAHDLVDFAGQPLNVVHRDVSPQNVFVTYDGTVKILDFGIAKAADSQNETRTGVIKGKVAYMAPEQFKGKADRRIDVYAVGVMLWQALTGQRLWKGLSDVEIYTALVSEGVPLPSTVTPGVDTNLEAICMKALAFKPEARFATAADLQHALEQWLESIGSRVTAREVGKCVAEMFVDHRTEAKAAIEKRIKQIAERKMLGQSAEHPVPSSMTRSGQTSMANSAPTSSLVPQFPSGTGPSQVSNQPASAQSGIAVLSAASPVTSRGRFIAIAVIGLLGVAILAVGLATGRARESAPAPAPVAVKSVESASPAAVAAPVSALIELTISATPDTARVYLDGMMLPNPTVSKFPRDGATHLVRAEAPGFERKEEFVTFAMSELQIQMALVKSGTKAAPTTAPANTGKHASAPSATAPSPPTVTEAPPVPPVTSAAPATSGKQKTTLDKNDPWTTKPH